jgi:hypothetical protein
MTWAITRGHAIELACREGGVTSLQLAHVAKVSTATAANKLAGYVSLGYLKVVSGSGGAGHPYVYRATKLGQHVLDGYNPQAGVIRWDFDPLLACWGQK